MAGIHQHEIPQLYQRGFLIPDTGSAERIFVFRKDRIYPSNINRSGAERYFYSAPNDGDATTLDDTITDYESKRLTSLVVDLRNLPHNAQVDPSVAAEVITHLTSRNAHLRGTFKFAHNTMIDFIGNVLADEERLRMLMGLTGTEVPPAISEKIGEVLGQHGTELPIPRQLVDKIAFAFVREQFSAQHSAFAASFLGVVGSLLGETEQLARDQHRKLLSQDGGFGKRANDLSTVTWRVRDVGGPMILPDCVAICCDQAQQFYPLMMSNVSEIIDIFLPLSSGKLLVGHRLPGDRLIEPARFNQAAAACSHAYFLAGTNLPEIADLTSLIGSQSFAVIEKALALSLSAALAAPVPETKIDVFRLPLHLGFSPPRTKLATVDNVTGG